MATAPIRHGEAHHLALSREEIVVCVDQVDLHFVRSGRQAVYVDSIAVTGIRPQPWQVVDSYVQMSHAWRRLQRTLPKYSANANIFRSVLDPDQALGQSFGERRIDNQF